MYDLSAIDTNFLDDIYKFLSNKNGSKIEYIELHICLDSKDSNVFHQSDGYKSQFTSIGFDLWIDEHPAYKTQCLLIKKHEESAYPQVDDDIANFLEWFGNTQ